MKFSIFFVLHKYQLKWEKNNNEQNIVHMKNDLPFLFLELC